MNFSSSNDAKAWKDIWGCGQGIGAIDKLMTTAEYVAQLQQEYNQARECLANGLRFQA
jgi:nitronate monooxygenase